MDTATSGRLKEVEEEEKEVDAAAAETSWKANLANMWVEHSNFINPGEGTPTFLLSEGFHHV